MAPLALAGVPQGSYTGAMLTFGASTVTYIDAVTGLPACPHQALALTAATRV